MFHICTQDGAGGLSKYSFLCPNGTVFNQEYFICDWWFNFDCSEAEGLYSLNDDIAAEREAATQGRAKLYIKPRGCKESILVQTHKCSILIMGLHIFEIKLC